MKKNSDHFRTNIENARINFAMNEADKILDDVWSNNNPNYDHGAVIFSLFIDCIHYLTLMGWTERDLINEVFDHSEDPMEEEDDDA